MTISTSVGAQIDKGQLEHLVAQYPYGRYCEDTSISPEASRRFMLDHVRDYLSRGDSECAAAFSSSGELVGIALFKLSQWDTEHFGYNVAIIESIMTKGVGFEQRQEIAAALLEQFGIWARAANVRFVSVKIPALDLPVVHSCECGGFRYIESWIYNKHDLHPVEELGEARYRLRLARPDDCSVMLDYAKGAFVTHRFYADPHIPQQKADSLYDKWILTAFRDSRQEIAVLDVENRPAAFMIYYKEDLRHYFGLQFAMWKMAVLDPASRGKGLGTDFFIALMHHHRQDGLEVVDSGLSMRNLASLNLHNKLKFKVISTLVTFHKWLA